METRLLFQYGEMVKLLAPADRIGEEVKIILEQDWGNQYLVEDKEGIRAWRFFADLTK